MSDETHETKTYEDGTTATGTPPLPDLSPDEQARLEAHVAMEREAQAHTPYAPDEARVTQQALIVTDAPRIDHQVEREPTPPRPAQPDVNMDHQTVVDWVFAELAHLRSELRAAGHEVLP